LWRNEIDDIEASTIIINDLAVATKHGPGLAAERQHAMAWGKA
jgi:hypothetical protein